MKTSLKNYAAAAAKVAAKRTAKSATLWFSVAGAMVGAFLSWFLDMQGMNPLLNVKNMAVGTAIFYVAVISTFRVQAWREKRALVKAGATIKKRMSKMDYKILSGIFK